MYVFLGPEGTPACPEQHFLCDLSKCLPQQYRCDGQTQCDDGTDELSCDFGRELLFLLISIKIPSQILHNRYVRRFI